MLLISYIFLIIDSLLTLIHNIDSEEKIRRSKGGRTAYVTRSKGGVLVFEPINSLELSDEDSDIVHLEQPMQNVIVTEQTPVKRKNNKYNSHHLTRTKTFNRNQTRRTRYKDNTNFNKLAQVMVKLTDPDVDNNTINKIDKAFLKYLQSKHASKIFPTVSDAICKPSIAAKLISNVKDALIDGDIANSLKSDLIAILRGDSNADKNKMVPAKEISNLLDFVVTPDYVYKATSQRKLQLTPSILSSLNYKPYVTRSKVNHHLIKHYIRFFKSQTFIPSGAERETRHLPILQWKFMARIYAAYPRMLREIADRFPDEVPHDISKIKTLFQADIYAAVWFVRGKLSEGTPFSVEEEYNHRYDEACSVHEKDLIQKRQLSKKSNKDSNSSKTDVDDEYFEAEQHLDIAFNSSFLNPDEDFTNETVDYTPPSFSIPPEGHYMRSLKKGYDPSRWYHHCLRTHKKEVLFDILKEENIRFTVKSYCHDCPVHKNGPIDEKKLEKLLKKYDILNNDDSITEQLRLEKRGSIQKEISKVSAEVEKYNMHKM
mgnify:CR=1 FL=1